MDANDQPSSETEALLALGLSQEGAEQFARETRAVDQLHTELIADRADLLGVYRNPQRGSTDIQIASTEPITFERASLRRRGIDSSVTWVRSPINQTDAAIVQDDIHRAILNEEARTEHIVHVDVTTGRIQVVFVDAAARDRLAPSVLQAAARFADIVDIKVDPDSSVRPASLRQVGDTCLSRQQCLPTLRGGLQITSTASTCSTAFSGRANSNNGRLIFTAGHCGNNLTAFTHSGTVIGVVSFRQYGGNVDGATIPLVATVTSDSLVYRTDAFDSQAVRSVEGRGFTSAVGDIICKSGRTTDTTCGSLTVRDMSGTTADGTAYTNFRVVELCALPGDSGGSVWRTTQAHGITSLSNFADFGGTHVCSLNPRMLYPSMLNVENAAGARVATVAGG